MIPIGVVMSLLTFLSTTLRQCIESMDRSSPSFLSFLVSLFAICRWCHHEASVLASWKKHLYSIKDSLNRNHGGAIGRRARGDVSLCYDHRIRITTRAEMTMTTGGCLGGGDLSVMVVCLAFLIGIFVVYYLQSGGILTTTYYSQKIIYSLSSVCSILVVVIIHTHTHTHAQRCVTNSKNNRANQRTTNDERFGWCQQHIPREEIEREEVTERERERESIIFLYIYLFHSKRVYIVLGKKTRMKSRGRSCDFDRLRDVGDLDRRGGRSSYTEEFQDVQEGQALPGVRL